MRQQANNPKMQPGIKSDFRRWQLSAHHQGDYDYGECPLCGTVGNAIYEQPSDKDNVHEDWFECDACNIGYCYETCYAYRYGGIDDDARR